MGGEDFSSMIEEYSEEGEFNIVTAFRLLEEVEKEPDAEKLDAVTGYLVDSLSGRNQADSYDEAVLNKALDLEPQETDQQFMVAYKLVETLAFKNIEDFGLDDTEYLSHDEDPDFEY